MDNEKFQGLVLQQLQSLNEGQEEICKDLTNLEHRMENLENRMENLEHKTDRIDSCLLKLESRIENEVIDKISALFNGHGLRGDQFVSLKKHIDERLDSIEIDTGYLVSKVARLEKMAK